MLPGYDGLCCDTDDCCSKGTFNLGGYMQMTASWDSTGFNALVTPVTLEPFTTQMGVSTYMRFAPSTSSDETESYSQGTGSYSTSSADTTTSYSTGSSSYLTSSGTPYSTSMAVTSTTAVVTHMNTLPALYASGSPSEASTVSTSTPSTASDTTTLSPASTAVTTSAPGSMDDHESSSNNSALSKDQTIGIGVGCGLAAIALILAVLYCYRRRRRRAQHNTADSHNNPYHFGMRRYSDVPETASMIAEADPAHEVTVELGGLTWVEAPEKGSPPEKEKSGDEGSPPESVMYAKESKLTSSHAQDGVQT